MYQSFSELKKTIYQEFLSAPLISPKKWQGVTVSGKPDLQTYELLNHHSAVSLPSESLGYYRRDIGPDIPWADLHFEERVCGYPLNPGTEWKNWRMGKGANDFRLPDGTFQHNYMSRWWPKYAGMVPPSETVPENWEPPGPPHKGILYEYGDLRDVVNQLIREPDTRQAVISMWFPEDNGVVHGGRAPCSLTWQFIVRDNKIHLTYNLRSVDLINHFRNDLYMAVRLLLWVLDECRATDPNWYDIKPGTLTTNIVSFHLFAGNRHQLKELL